jgi:hypothetical protein
LRDAGSDLAASGNEALVLGNAGAGSGIVHVHLTNPEATGVDTLPLARRSAALPIEMSASIVLPP